MQKPTSVRLPKWAITASILCLDQLNTLDSAEFIEEGEWDYEWRLCQVPVDILPSIKAEDLCVAEPDQMEGIRAWFNSVGIEKALSKRPLVVLWEPNAAKLLDGYHRLAAANEIKAKTVICSVGFKPIS